MPVAEVDAAQLEDRDRLGIGLLAPVLLQLLLELHDHEGEVVADEVRAPDDQEAPRQIVEGIMMISTVARTPTTLSSRAARTAPPVAPTKKT